jgi:hypothetical protein
MRKKKQRRTRRFLPQKSTKEPKEKTGDFNHEILEIHERETKTEDKTGLNREFFLLSNLNTMWLQGKDLEYCGKDLRFLWEGGCFWPRSGNRMWYQGMKS